MRVLTTAAELRAELHAARCAGRSVGLVPTMGALHDGHVALVDRAVGECDVVVVSVFVNPLQFGPAEDFAGYPRDLARDVAVAAGAGAGLVFAPSVDEMYPGLALTTVSVAGLSEPLDGAARPGHFDGVATVVAKLFALAGACRAYFGEKDYQQLAVVRRMAADLSFPVEVVGCPTVRAADGLALSSRNAYLTDEERAAAPVLHRGLLAGAASILAGEIDPEAVRGLMAAVIGAEALVHLEYAEVVDAATLSVPAVLVGELRLLVAARIGRARLIDNEGVTAPP